MTHVSIVVTDIKDYHIPGYLNNAVHHVISSVKVSNHIMETAETTC